MDNGEKGRHEKGIVVHFADSLGEATTGETSEVITNRKKNII